MPFLFVLTQNYINCLYVGTSLFAGRLLAVHRVPLSSGSALARDIIICGRKAPCPPPYLGILIYVIGCPNNATDLFPLSTKTKEYYISFYMNIHIQNCSEFIICDIYWQFNYNLYFRHSFMDSLIKIQIQQKNPEIKVEL